MMRNQCLFRKTVTEVVRGPWASVSRDCSEKKKKIKRKRGINLNIHMERGGSHCWDELQSLGDVGGGGV